ncbi:energy transducer TonB [Niveispirillum sp. KHB5.9]|uniref:energy transducer TonB n=1 Tax=Niveispirillum sp. KHB5.9 TaxID=3400269 RepID=UPI003A853D04
MRINPATLGPLLAAAFMACTPAKADPQSLIQGNYELPEPDSCAVPNNYPTTEYNKSREGWVDLRFTVKADGSVTDIETAAIMGRDAFAEQATRWLRNCRFKPALENGKPVDAQNIVRRFHYRMDMSAGADRGIRTRLLEVNGMIQQGKLDEAEAALDAIEPDARYIYEFVHILLRRASIMALRDRTDIALLYLWQLSSSNEFLEPEEYGRYLRMQLQLELKHGLLNSALWTLPHFKDLGKRPGDDKLVTALEKLKTIAASDQPMLIVGRIPSECRGIICPTSTPSWDYFPVRRTLSLTAIEGNLDQVEGRCAHKTFKMKAEAGVTWTIPASWGQCAIRITGAPGSSFKLIDENV